jgi:hypothetical protein
LVMRFILRRGRDASSSSASLVEGLRLSAIERWA